LLVDYLIAHLIGGCSFSYLINNRAGLKLKGIVIGCIGQQRIQYLSAHICYQYAHNQGYITTIRITFMTPLLKFEN